MDGGEKMPPSKPFAGWVEGTAEEVICLGFMLDIGDIKEPVDSAYRKELIYSLYAQNQYGRSAELEEELRQVGDVYARELQRLKSFLEDGEADWRYSRSFPDGRGRLVVCQED